MSSGLFFDLEPEIVKRLRAALPAGVPVLTADELDDVEERSQPAPAVHVIYDGYSVTQAQPTVSITRQRWLVVVVVKHAGAAVKASAESKSRAAPLVLAVIDALHGFRPCTRPGSQRLTLDTPPRPARRTPFFYFPSLFTADVPVTSRSNQHG